MIIAGRECHDQHDLMMAILVSAGGRDIIRPPSADGEMADVLFDRENWIFEVKSLESDRPSDPGVAEQLGERLSKDAPRFGGPVVFGTAIVNTSQLPVQTARNVLRIWGQSVQDGLRKGNRQIRSTKSMFGRPTANGCLVIICPPHKLDQEMIPFLIGDAIKRNSFSSVQSLIVAQSPLLAPFGRRAGSSAVTFIDRENHEMPIELKQRIGGAWAQAHGQPLVYGRPLNGGR